MKIIVLAAGQGKRMWPIKQDKCLIPFLGKPLLYHNLKQIKDVLNPDEVIVISSQQSKAGILKILEALGISGTIAIQNESKGMADALLSAQDFIQGEILILNAEDQLESKVFESVLDMARTKADGVFVGLKVKNYFPGGYLAIDGKKVIRVVEKPGEGNEPSDLVKLVVDYFKDGGKLLSYLESAQSNNDDRYEVALDRMIQDGLDVRFTKYDGVWIPLKFPWHVLDIMGALLAKIEQKISPGAKVSEKAEISGKVVIEEGAKVFEGAVIKGPCYIGKDCMVGGNSLIRESNLEKGCVTGFNTDITRSYIGANSWFHTNYIGDSVIEGDLGMGSGAVLANLRLDNKTVRVGVGDEMIDSGRHKLGLMVGSGARVGVNASIMPGVRVGANSLVGPGVVLHEDVKENTKILVKQEYQVSQHSPSLTSYDQFRDKLEK